MILLTFIVSIFMGFYASHVAKKKNKSQDFWFWIGFIFGIFGVLYLIFFVKKEEKKQSPKTIKKPFLLNLQRNDTNILWYYVENNDQNGPISLYALSEKFQKGKVKPSTYVWNEEMNDWKKIEELLIKKIPSASNTVNK